MDHARITNQSALLDCVAARTVQGTAILTTLSELLEFLSNGSK